MSEASENPRPRIAMWTRRFGAPLRETFQVDADDDSDEFIDLLASADQRLSQSRGNGGHFEGA